MIKSVVIKKIMRVAAVLFCCLTILSGCAFFDFSDGISAVRERVETLRYEMSDTMIEAFKNKDVARVKSLFCPKTRQLPDIDKQIEATFSFMEGNIKEYKVSVTTGNEGYSNDYGKVTEYSFTSDVYITTDVERKYVLCLSVHYIIDDVIKGMTLYSLYEDDRDYENIKRCRAGYGWSSPYDAECGIIAARLIQAVGNSDINAAKELLCKQSIEITKIDDDIRAVFDLFDGKPTFTERADGLYNASDSEEDFTCRVLGYENKKDDDGNIVSVWVSVLVQSVYTDTGKDYRLHFVAYLVCDNDPSIVGISFFSFEDWAADVEKQVGVYIRE